MIAEILIEVFGSALIRVGPEGRTKVTVLPSPEELKGRILFKVGAHSPFASIDQS